MAVGVIAPGSWPSPFTPEAVTAAGRQVREVAYGPDGVPWWAELRPDEGGRTVLLTPAGVQVPEGFDARSAFHEYGGLCWLPVDHGLVSVDMRDQRLWRVSGSSVEPLTADTGGRDRYALPQKVPGGLLVLRERLGDPVRNALVLLPEGSGPEVVLWDSSDFVDGPRVSPNGTHLAFVTWDHPRMPWDGTELRVAAFSPAGLTDVRVLLGGPAEAVFQPEWEPNGGLRAVTDASGWWNLVRVPLDGGTPVPVWEVEQECGWPWWTPGYASHAGLPDGSVAVLHGRAGQSLSVVGPAGVRALELPLTAWAPLLAASGTRVLGVAGSWDRGFGVVQVDTTDGSVDVLAEPPLPEPGWAPRPERVEVPSTQGRTTYAHVYPPTSPRHEAGEPAPYVLMVHGGPTAQSSARYQAQTAFWTSRGFGVADVDHGGSTGQGRAYRELLRGRWGEVDVDDCEAVARWLLDTGKASAVVIRGGSAGGWTVLSALTRGGSPFAAGASYFGVADLAGMAAHTHDFESRYLAALVPPEQWAERSPLAHIDRLDRPLLVLQGRDDKVVPPEQAELLLAALAERGVPHAALFFEGEGHGFRRRETQVAALSAELAFYGQVLEFPTPDVEELLLR